MSIRFPHLGAAILVTALTLGATAPASAQDDGTDPAADIEDIDHLKQRCQRAIERRLDDLAATQVRLDVARALTDEHEAALDGIIDSTESGLGQLSTEIANEDNRLEVGQLCTQIATDYRVYLVVLPQAHLTVGADRIDAAVVHAHTLLDTFDSAVERAIEAGADVDSAVEFRDEAAAHVTDAEVANNGIAASALGVTPASYNDGDGAETLESARSAVRTSHSDLKAGAEDGKAAIAALREALGDAET